MAKETSPKLSFPPGSLLRVAWYDEIMGPAYSSPDGWVPPGVYFYNDIEGFCKHSEEEDDDLLLGNIDYPDQTIPFGTKGLLCIETHEDTQQRLWAKAVWEDRTIWIAASGLVLIKHSTLL